MKTLMIITAAFVLIMTVLLFACKSSGLHPNIGIWFVMIPFLFLFVWAKGQLIKPLK